MKLLWVNPSFLDYRVPVYKRLYELFDGNFYIIFSKERVPQRVIDKMKLAIGNNAIVFEGEKRLILGENEGMSNKWMQIPFTKGLYKKVKEVNADIVIAEGFFQWTPKAIKYCFLNHKPLIIAYERTKHTERFCPKWRSYYRKMVDIFTKGYLCNGILTREYLYELGIDKRKLYIGGMSADSKGLIEDIKRFTDNEKKKLKETLNINNKGLTYLYVGQLIERKGVNYLLEAWIKHIKINPFDKLLIIGGGNKFEEYCKVYSSFESIYFSGNIDYSEVYKYYAISDVFIIPTIEDNWSLVVPEAMSCGLPVATSIYNGCHPELVIKDVNGITFDSYKEETIIDALEYFHKVDLKSFGKNSIKIEQKYNYIEVSNKIFEAVNKIYQDSKL